jgi:Leucine-rich repeat (LRR) protein
MRAVVQLALDRNRIEHLTDMSDLQKLEYLDLSGNRLTSAYQNSSNMIFTQLFRKFLLDFRSVQTFRFSFRQRKKKKCRFPP